MATEQSGPNLQPGCVYRSSNLIASLRISSNTLKAWRKGPNGLKPLCEDGLKAPLFLADDVIAFLERRRGSSTSEKTSKAHPPRLRLGEVVNMENVNELLSEIIDLVRVLRPLAERAMAADHLWAPPAQRSERETLEAQAIVLLTTLEKPTVAGIARQLGVPRNTLRHWPHFAEACDRVWGGRVKSPRRGYVNPSGDVDGMD